MEEAKAPAVGGRVVVVLLEALVEARAGDKEASVVALVGLEAMMEVVRAAAMAKATVAT